VVIVVESTAHDRQKGERRMAQVRCLNCLARHGVPPGAERFVCPECGWEWRVSWVNPAIVKIRGPIWEKMGDDGMIAPDRLPGAKSVETDGEAN
jgi:hypothetical protein